MITEIGHFSLLLCLPIALALVSLPLLGASCGQNLWMRLAGVLASAQAVFVAIAFACLSYAFLSDDFSVKLVAMHSQSDLPLRFKFSALWGNHEGSLLLWLCIYLFKEYGWSVFVGLPFVVGMLSALLTGVHQKSHLGMCIGVASFASFLLGGLCFMLAMEGLICLAMAMPLAILMSILGGVVAYFIQAAYHVSRVPPTILLSLLLLMGLEKAEDYQPVTFPVTSTMEIDAPPEVVWRHVVSFHELPPVEDWLFKLGLAYPLRAEIKGTGVGAVRHCIFSTGPFVAAFVQGEINPINLDACNFHEFNS